MSSTKTLSTKRLLEAPQRHELHEDVVQQRPLEAPHSHELGTAKVDRARLRPLTLQSALVQQSLLLQRERLDTANVDRARLLP
jgi:hypothetical protein